MIVSTRRWSFAGQIAGTTVAVLLFGMVPRAAASESVSFQKRVLDSDGGKALVGDLNADGRADVVLRCGGYLAWCEYPKLTKHVIREGSFFGDRFVLGDVDGNGYLDVVSGEYSEGKKPTIFWYRNPLPGGQPRDGSSWKKGYVGNQEDYIKDLDVADVDADGSLDVVARSHEYTKIFFQQQDGFREKKVAHPRKEGMALADLDADGDVDLVLNGFWLETPANPRKGNYVFHEIDPKWYTQKTGKWMDNCCYVTVADLNADGILDVVLSHSEKPRYSLSWYSVDRLEKVRTGSWIERHVAERFDWCETVDVGDVDNDGTLDVLAAKFQRHDPENYDNKPPYPVTVFYNVKGDGSSWPSQTLSEKGIYAGVLGDVGSDGDLDVLGPRSYWTGPTEMWENKTSDRPLPLNDWNYIQVDNNRTERYFGLAMGDLTGDGNADIVAGKWFYRNPGGDMADKWKRSLMREKVDALLIVDVDGDELGDVIAVAPNQQYWLEAKDRQATGWKAVKIGSLPLADHRLGTQQYALAQIVPGGKPEILLVAGRAYYLEIPDDPGRGEWPSTCISEDGGGYAAGDIDGDGLVDMAGSYKLPGEGEIVPGTRNVKWWCSMVAWWKNPGDGSGQWKRFEVGKATHCDRFAVADLNGDGRVDIVTSEERYPGSVPNASLYWFEQPADASRGEWKRHLVVTQTSMNNLDAADVDRDGDTDIVTCEHKMPVPGSKDPVPDNERLQIWENDGRGNFTERRVDAGKECHLGARVFDMDGDGDLDIVGIAWRNYRFLHLWRNDAVESEP